MPELSAYLIFVGCALVLVMGIMIGVIARSSSEKLTQNFSVQSVAAMILDTRQFPPLLVQGSVATGDSLLASSIGTSSSLSAVADVKIVNLTLRETAKARDRPADSSDIEIYALSEG